MKCNYERGNWQQHALGQGATLRRCHFRSDSNPKRSKTYCKHLERVLQAGCTMNLKAPSTMNKLREGGGRHHRDCIEFAGAICHVGLHQPPKHKDFILSVKVKVRVT